MTEQRSSDAKLCEDCPPVGYPTDKTRCSECPRRSSALIDLVDKPGLAGAMREAVAADVAGARSSKSNYEITRTKAIKALSALWDIAFPERSGERCQEWAETNHLCAIWDPDSLEDQQDAMPPGIWDLMLALGVTPAELIEHCHANPKLFEGSPTNETTELSRALRTIDEVGKLSDWINRARPVITDLMQAYERRIRTDCTPEQLAKEPWRCMEYIGAEALLRDQPVAIVEIWPRGELKANEGQS